MADRREPGLLGVLDALHQLLGRVAEDVVVDARLVAHLAAQQLVDRHAEVLAGDVPERDVDRAERAHDPGAAKVARAVHVLPVVLDPQRVFAHQVVRPLLDDGLGRLEIPPGAGFAEPADAGVGVHLDEHVPIDQDRFDSRDLHAAPLPRGARTGRRLPGRVVRAAHRRPASRRLIRRLHRSRRSGGRRSAVRWTVTSDDHEAHADVDGDAVDPAACESCPDAIDPGRPGTSRLRSPMSWDARWRSEAYAEKVGQRSLTPRPCLSVDSHVHEAGFAASTPRTRRQAGSRCRSRSKRLLGSTGRSPSSSSTTDQCSPSRTGHRDTGRGRPRERTTPVPRCAGTRTGWSRSRSVTRQWQVGAVALDPADPRTAPTGDPEHAAKTGRPRPAAPLTAAYDSAANCLPGATPDVQNPHGSRIEVGPLVQETEQALVHGMIADRLVVQVGDQVVVDSRHRTSRGVCSLGITGAWSARAGVPQRVGAPRRRGRAGVRSAPARHVPRPPGTFGSIARRSSR